MTQFANPFPNAVTRRMTVVELLRAIRLEIASEQEAISLYESHAEASPNVLAAKVFRDIATEEKVHVHELQTLLYMLDKEEYKASGEGASEVLEMAAKSGVDTTGIPNNTAAK